MQNLRLISLLSFAVAALGVAAACGDDETTPPPATADAGTTTSDAGPRGIEQAGQACTAPTQCYLDKTAADGGDAGQLAINGTIACLDKVPNGYCTHECQSDSDCCAVPGECRTGIKQVCSPFTNTDTPKYCFLSCEEEDIRTGIAATDGGLLPDGGDAGLSDDNAYCQTYASTYATCRSSGGGNKNRKVCIPQQ